MKRIMVIFGTRPEAIKMAPVIHALHEHPEFTPIVCVTAQHREMLDQVLALFSITPDIDLDLMQQGQDLPSLTARVLTMLDPVLAQHTPDAILVQGDTTTTFAAALAAFYRKIPVGHIEAGLRTGDIHSPFPEEMNRLLTTRLAHWHFAPTPYNKDTLIKEGVNPDTIHVTGNPVIDALLEIKQRIESKACSKKTLGWIEKYQRPYILVTGHRRESFGEGFESICQALKQLATTHPELDIIYPVHLNPQVQEPVNRILGGTDNVHLIAPLDYEAFVAAMTNALFILTDSGGVQEEAPSLGKPVLVMRDKTERIEALEAGVRLVGTDMETIINECEKLLGDEKYFQQLAGAINPYGDGTAATKIINILAC